MEEELRRIDATKSNANSKTIPFELSAAKKRIQEENVLVQTVKSENKCNSNKHLFDSCFGDVEELVFPDIQATANTKLSELLTGIRKAKERNAYEATQCQQVGRKSEYFCNSEKKSNQFKNAPSNGHTAGKRKKSSVKHNKNQKGKGKPELYGNKGVHVEEHVNSESQSDAESEDANNVKLATEPKKTSRKRGEDILVSKIVSQDSDNNFIDKINKYKKSRNLEIPLESKNDKLSDLRRYEFSSKNQSKRYKRSKSNDRTLVKSEDISLYNSSSDFEDSGLNESAGKIVEEASIISEDKYNCKSPSKTCTENGNSCIMPKTLPFQLNAKIAEKLKKFVAGRSEVHAPSDAPCIQTNIELKNTSLNKSNVDILYTSVLNDHVDNKVPSEIETDKTPEKFGIAIAKNCQVSVSIDGLNNTQNDEHNTALPEATKNNLQNENVPSFTIDHESQGQTNSKDRGTSQKTEIKMPSQLFSEIEEDIEHIDFNI